MLYLLQILLNLLPSLCIWVAYLLPAHTMSGLYSGSNEFSIWEYIGECKILFTPLTFFPHLTLIFVFGSNAGYMLLFLTMLQMLAHFCSHLLLTRMASSILLMLFIWMMTAGGGYAIHLLAFPDYLKWWSEILSPQRWILPVILADEFSEETLANTVNQQLCRNRQVNSFKISEKKNKKKY